VPDAVEPEDLMRLIARVTTYRNALERIARKDEANEFALMRPSGECPDCWSVEIATEALEAA
jgi:hypothetical protein